MNKFEFIYNDNDQLIEWIENITANLDPESTQIVDDYHFVYDAAGNLMSVYTETYANLYKYDKYDNYAGESSDFIMSNIIESQFNKVIKNSTMINYNYYRNRISNLVYDSKIYLTENQTNEDIYAFSKENKYEVDCLE